MGVDCGPGSRGTGGCEQTRRRLGGFPLPVAVAHFCSNFELLWLATCVLVLRASTDRTCHLAINEKRRRTVAASMTRLVTASPALCQARSRQPRHAPPRRQYHEPAVIHALSIRRWQIKRKKSPVYRALHIKVTQCVSAPRRSAGLWNVKRANATLPTTHARSRPIFPCYARLRP